VLKWQVRALTVFLVAMLVAFGAMGFRGDGVGRFERVETKAFVLKDDAGNNRLKIAVDRDGTVLQEFLGWDQKQQLILKATRDGMVRVRSFQTNGKPGFSVSSTPTRKGLNGIGFYDRNGVQRATLQYNADSAGAFLNLRDQDDNSRVWLSHTKNDDKTELSLNKGERLFSAQVLEKRTRVGVVRDGHFKSMLLDNVEDKISGIMILDDDNKIFMNATVNRGSNFAFKLRQTTGEQMWDVLGKLGTVASAAALAGLTGDNTPPTCTGRGRYLQYDGGWRCASD